ncbi:MAG TPA: glutathione S-transferase family protein [Solirubrobacteraceae bacterium]|jgi:glutathione S-transferase
MRVYRIPYSTNVERVALALAHKSMPVDWVDVDPADRSPVVELSGQDLVPVLEADHGEVVSDSMRIVDWLEKRRPDPPLWPAHAGRRAEVDVFIEWFNRVWKVPPNAMAAELAKDRPDERLLHDLSDELRGWLHLFEDMLDGRDWLMSETFGAADLCAFPFLKYGVLDLRPDDSDPFHHVLAEHLPIKGAFPAIEAWVHRVDGLARA